MVEEMLCDGMRSLKILAFGTKEPYFEEAQVI